MEEQLLEDRDDDSYVLSRVTEVLHSLFKVYRAALFPYFDQIVGYCNQLLVGPIILESLKNIQYSCRVRLFLFRLLFIC